MIDPDTLEVLATYDTPTTPDPPGTKAYRNLVGGGYFFLDGRDRIWSATKTSHLFVRQVSPDGRSITKVGDYDLTAALQNDERITSALPVFEAGASATENSLMASMRSLFVENNYGYQDPFEPSSGALTTPGCARVDVNTRGRRLRRTSRTERAPSVVPKLSTGSGLGFDNDSAGIAIGPDGTAYLGVTGGIVALH